MQLRSARAKPNGGYAGGLPSAVGQASNYLLLII